MMGALFVGLINMSITATFVALAVIVLRFSLKKFPKWISYVLWSVVLFRLICPFSFTSAFSALGRVGAPVTENNVVSYIPTDTATTQEDFIINPSETSAGILLENSEADTVSAVSKDTYIFIGTAVWLAGITGIFLYSAFSYVRLKRRVADAIRIEGNIYETDAINAPFVCGILTPSIYLPVGLSEDERRYVLLHEKTHIRRRDYLIKPFAFLALTFHWFNPVIWLCFRLMRQDMEMSCDERVIRELGRDETADYGTALLQLRVKRPRLLGSPLAFGEDSTKGRIKNVLNYKKPAFWIIAIAVIVLAAAAVFLLANPINANKHNPLSNDPVYRNGLYFVTSEVENGEATIAFLDDFVYYEGAVTGSIEITWCDMGTNNKKDSNDSDYPVDYPVDYPGDTDVNETSLSDIQDKFVFTWMSETEEHQMDNYYARISTDTDIPLTYGMPLIYGIKTNESIQAGKEDISIRINITNFDQPLEFIIPAEGTAPEYGILYGKFSPSDIIYLSAEVSDDSEAFLNAARNVVFSVSKSGFVVTNSINDKLIRDAPYGPPCSTEVVLDETFNWFGDEAVSEVDISRYTSKIIYTVEGLGVNVYVGFYSILLMDDETWIGYWSWVEDDSDGHQLRCDYIFKVENVNNN